jgi:DNA polymerase I
MKTTNVVKKENKKIPKKRLVLLDSHAIIHRAYHAIPDFTSPNGAPTGALYGLSSMLLKIITDLKPDYIAACYDLPKPTIRHEAYAGYKATRMKTDDALSQQLGTSRKVFEAFGIPIYEREGFEADDILGTICEILKEDNDIEIIIASGDMDTLQLVEKTRVKVYTLKKGLNDTIMYDAQAVLERYGFAPGLVPDYKGLRGDPSDNIIGIAGIGEKTGTDLIVGFGTIEQIYKILKKGDEPFIEKGIKPRIIQLLKDHEEDALFSKMLATIRLDAPIIFSLADTVFRSEHTLPNILSLFDELGFRTLRPRAKVVFEKEGGEDSKDEVAEEKVRDEIPPEKLQEAQIMLWLLASDITKPTLEDIFTFTKKERFADAYTSLQSSIESTGELDTLYTTIEKPLIKILRGMETHGVLIDTEKLQVLSREYTKEVNTLEKKIYVLAGREFNVSSPKQLAEILYDDLKLHEEGSTKSPKKTAGGARTTKESEIEKLAGVHPIISEILEYRELKKLLSTYIEAIPKTVGSDGRLHPEFLQSGTTTGRMSCQNPNLQNIPIRTERGRAIRTAICAPTGYTLLAFDYSQVELRIAAILSGDEKLCEIFRQERDVHTEVAREVFGVAADAVDGEMRRRAKIINFGILYGMGVNALKAQLGTSTAEAHLFYEEYFKTFKTLAKFLESTKGSARRQGFTETLFGRRREFSGMKSSLPYVRAQAERMAINAPIQGTAADVIKFAMVRVQEMIEHEKAQEEVKMILQVHDELVFEIKDSHVEKFIEKIRQVMEHVITKEDSRSVPLLVQAKKGKNWGTLTSL